MAISVNWGTKVIFIPQVYLSHISGSLYELDTNQFRLDLKALEDDPEGMPYEKTHIHNTEVIVAGVVFSRSIEIINGYMVEFQSLPSAYSVRLTGSNNNIFDIQNGILVQNNVQVIPTNSAGLQTVVQGSGITEQDKLDIADRVWDEPTSGHKNVETFGHFMQIKLLTVAKFIGLK